MSRQSRDFQRSAETDDIDRKRARARIAKAEENATIAMSKVDALSTKGLIRSHKESYYMRLYKETWIDVNKGHLAAAARVIQEEYANSEYKPIGDAVFDAQKYTISFVLSGKKLPLKFEVNTSITGDALETSVKEQFRQLYDELCFRCRRPDELTQQNSSVPSTNASSMFGSKKDDLNPQKKEDNNLTV